MTSARTRRLTLAGGLLALAAAAVSPVLAAEAAVSIAGLAFEPATIEIAPGDTVTWTVTESIGQDHSVTSGTPSEDSGLVFDSGIEGLRDEGGSFEFTFDDAGEYPYYCKVHPVQMTGTVVVVAAGASAPPSIEPPPSEHETGIPVERRALAGGVLAISIALMFGAAWVWRRMNPA